jgi:hypothetical protein
MIFYRPTNITGTPPAKALGLLLVAAVFICPGCMLVYTRVTVPPGGAVTVCGVADRSIVSGGSTNNTVTPSGGATVQPKLSYK